MKIKDLAQTITAVAGAVAVIGGVLYATGWVVSRSAVEAIAEEQAQQKANEVAASLASEATSREKGDLKLQLELAIKELEYLYSLPKPNPAQVLRKDILLDQVRAINLRLTELNK